VNFWETSTWSPKWENGAASSGGYWQIVSFSSDGKTLVAGGCRRGLDLLDAHTGNKIRTLGNNTGCPYDAAISPDGSFVAAPFAGGLRISLLSAASGKEVKTLGNHSNTPTAIAFSPDGATVASTGQDGPLRLWNTNGNSSRKFERPETQRTAFERTSNSVSITADGRSIAVGYEDGEVILWDFNTGSAIASAHFKGTPASFPNQTKGAARFSQDGTMLAVSAGDTVTLWSVRRP